MTEPQLSQMRFTLSQVIQIAILIAAGTVAWASLKSDMAAIKLTVAGQYNKQEIDKFRSEADRIHEHLQREINRIESRLNMKVGD